MFIVSRSGFAAALCLSVASLTIAGCAAQSTKVASAETVSADPTDPNRTVCRRLPVTGSISRVKVCKTAAEWAQEAGHVDASAGDGIHSTGAAVQVH